MKNVNTACSYEDEMVIYSSMSEKTQRVKHLYEDFQNQKEQKEKSD